MIRLTAPAFWYDTTDPSARLKTALLRPLSHMWCAITRARIAFGRPYTPKAAVVCIGNVTVGGAGKTPVAVTVLTALRDSKISNNPCFLTRGFGGSTKDATLVDLNKGTFDTYGDEALLLARHAPTIVARNRVEGLKLADASGYDLVVVDDGFQNPYFGKTMSILVFDGVTGLGNGLCLPAGPCRERLQDALKRASAALIVGEDQTHLRAKLHALPVFAANFKAAHNSSDTPYVAFAGIGRPQKFFTTLADSGYNIVDTASFPDHHVYEGADMNRLIAHAAGLGARLITTEKDFVRVPDEAKSVVDVLPVTLKIDGLPEMVTLMRTKIRPS